MAGACVALIGGGRWGRVHASVLARMSSRIDRILTRHNKSALDAFLSFQSLELLVRDSWLYSPQALQGSPSSTPRKECPLPWLSGGSWLTLHAIEVQGSEAHCEG